MQSNLGKSTDKKRLRLSSRTKHWIVGYSFILPWIIGFVALFIHPFLKTIWISFGEIIDSSTYAAKFVGLDNYVYALTSEVRFLPLLFQTIKDTLINVPLITIFALFIAILLNKNFKGRSVFRVICFLPVMLGAGFIMKQLLGHDIDKSTMETVKKTLLPREITIYLGTEVTNLIVLFLNRLTLILWGSGVQILIFLSGLQSIPGTLYEAAKMDSCTEWEALWFITMPMMAPMVLLCLVYTLVDTYASVNNPLIDYIYGYIIEYPNPVHAAAVGIIYLVFVFLVVGLIFVLFKRPVDRVKS